MSIFSKQQYIWLASVMRDELHASKNTNEILIKSTQKIMIENLANALEEENPNFNPSRFFHNIYCANDHKKNETCPYDYYNSKISLETIAEFTWGFGQNFLLKVNSNYYIWSDPEYNGNNTIKPYHDNPKNFTSQGFSGRDKGIHKIIDYCGPNVKFINK